MFKRLETVITMEIYDKSGNFKGKRAEYIYKALVKKQDIIIGLLIALVIGSQIL